jgi:hypothetical protein
MSLDNFTKQISQLIESQFPAIYREDGETLVAFIQAYYEFLESSDKYTYNLGRQMFDIDDIDTTLDEFLSHFKETYLADFPYKLGTDKRFAVKHISDFYKAKGSERSLQLLMKLIFNEDVTVYKPSEDILRPSDSLWYKPRYLEVTKTDRNKTYLNQQVIGSQSGAKAFVESVVRKRVKGKVFDVLYISSLQGDFETGENVVTEDGVIEGSPTIVGSMSEITLDLGGRNNAVGDIFKVVTDEGLQGRAKVSSVRAATGRVDFSIANSGWGYTTTSSTDVYVSKALLFVNNSVNDSYSGNTLYYTYETVYQPVETVRVYSATNILSANLGSYLLGMANSTTQVANSVIVGIANTDSNGTITTAATSNGIITVITNAGTFSDQRVLTMNTTPNFATGEILSEQSVYEVGYTNLSGVFQVSEIVEQYTREAVSNTTTNYAFGTVTVAGTGTLTLQPAWGTFDTSATAPLIVGKTSGASALPTTFTITTPGAKGLITNITGSNVSVTTSYGAWDVGNAVRGDKTRVIRVITNNVTGGASIVYLNGSAGSNGLISQANATPISGMVIGQNTTAIGLHGNTAAFYFSNAYPTYVYTRRSDLVSPPRYANNEIIEINKQILRIAGGVGANFEVGTLEDIESNVTLYTDILGANNVAGSKFVDMKIDGRGSGFGYVTSMTINSGGTGYANLATVSFTGGGYGAGDPLVPASGTITTNASGVITLITINTNGEGYYDYPTVVLPATGGTVANVTTNMTFGFGFPKSPSSGASALIGDALNTTIANIGSIALLSKINPGTGYTADPFVRVRNKYVASYRRRDYLLNVTGVTGGSFTVGEDLIQLIGGTTTFKGTVRAVNISGGTGTVFVSRKALSVSIDTAYPIKGSVTGAQATITGIISDDASRYIGDNADIIGTAISADGIATSLEVVSSGFGYINNGAVTLEFIPTVNKTSNPFIITGFSQTLKQGQGLGYWKTTTSHLNSEKKIHDNKYYQEYAYDIQSGISLDKYEKILKKAFHVAGTRMFGSVIKASVIDSQVWMTGSSITKNRIANTYLVTESGANLITKSGSYLVIRKETQV